LRRGVAAAAGDDHVARAAVVEQPRITHEQRLQHTVLRERSGELDEAFVAHVTTRLVGIGGDLLDGHDEGAKQGARPIRLCGRLRGRDRSTRLWPAHRR